MTCIVGIEHPDGVIVGGDSAGLAGWQKTIRADTKVFTVGDYVMGFTSSFRMGQLLRYSLDPPEPTGDLDRFMATIFIDAVRKTLTDGGFARNRDGSETGGCFLVGVCGQLYLVDSDYRIGRSVDGYMAVGCGSEIALGSLHTTNRYAFDPSVRVVHALEAAAPCSGGVAGPFTVIDQPFPEGD